MQRSTEEELIDLGGDFYTPEEYRDALHKLDRIGEILGGDRATLSALKELKKKPKTILDVGCGGGYFTQKLGEKYPDAKIVGLDIDAEAVKLCRENNRCPNVSYVHAESTDWEFPSGAFDVVIATLVCHHLSDRELVLFLRKLSFTAKDTVVINDLHRHPLALFGFSLITPVFFSNRLIKHDGRISIKKGFVKSDWKRLLGEAGIPENRYKITWKWAYRWIVTIKS